MKRLIYLFALIAALGMTSCNDDDGYSLDDVVITAATYHQTDGYFYLVNDDGQSLWPAAGIGYYPGFEDGDRVTVNYTPLGKDPDGVYDLYVRLNAMDEMLTKDMVQFDETTTQNVRDSIGYDPIYIDNAWIVDDYLTVVFEFPATYAISMVNIVDDKTLDKTEDGATILELNLNSFDAPYIGYTGWGVASFNILKLRDEADGASSINIALRSRDDNGEYVNYSSNITYYFGDKEPRKNTISLNKFETSKEANLK
ncbi:MAG: hypothetical protein ACK5MI_00115 [Mangrovibacterium sp.]